MIETKRGAFLLDVLRPLRTWEVMGVVLSFLGVRLLVVGFRE